MSKTPEISVNRAATILPILWLTFIIFLSLVLYLSISSGIFASKFIDPLKKNFNSFVASLEVTPTPSPIPTPTSFIPTPKAKVPTVTTKKTVTTTCIQKNIREGEFASNKCYFRANYDDLNYYLARYSSAAFDLSGANGTIKITCNCRVPQECEFFKDSCAEAQAKKSQAEADMNKYRSTIQSIIAKGR